MDLIRPSGDTPLEALREAVAILGGQSATGRFLGVTQRAVWRWLNENTVLPAEHVLPLEAGTGVPRYRLRSDIYPIDLPASVLSPSTSQGAKVPDGRNSSFPDAPLGPEASQTVAGGEAARSSDDPGRAADTPEEIAPVEAAPPIGKAAA